MVGVIPRRDYGVDAETVAVGENAAAMLPFTGFTTKQEQTVNDLTDSVYHGFLEKASPGVLSESCRELLWIDIYLVLLVHMYYT